MTRLTRLVFPGAAALLTVAVLAGSAAAAPKTVTVADIHKLIETMGMQDGGDGKTFASVDNQGKDDITVMFYPYDDGRAVRIYTFLGDIPKEKLAAMPVRKLLDYNNDLHSFFFALDDSDDGKKNLNLTMRADAAAISPTLLRKDIDQLLLEVDETRDLWDPQKWDAAPVAAAPAAKTPDKTADKTADMAVDNYMALTAKADAIWDKGPIGIGKIIMTSNKVEGYGTEVPLEGSTLKRGDTLHLYVLPIAFGYRKDGENEVLDMDADILLQKGGTTFADAKSVAKLKQGFPYRYKRVDFTFDIELSNTLPVGAYEATVIIHDKTTAKDATAKIGFMLQ